MFVSHVFGTAWWHSRNIIYEPELRILSEISSRPSLVNAILSRIFEYRLLIYHTSNNDLKVQMCRPTFL